MMRAAFRATAAGLGFLSFSASYAGGENWTFAITAFTSDGDDKYVMELSPLEKGSSFPVSCATLTITGEYESLFWFFKFGSGPTKAEHKAALELLGDAFKTRTPINFGWIGDGVHTTQRSGACTATSRGLTVDSATTANAIYSYYKWP